VNEEDAIAGGQDAAAMCHDQDDSIAGEDIKRRDEFGFRAGIEWCCRFVEHKNIGASKECPCDRDATPLFEVSAPMPDEPYRTPLMLPQFLIEGALRERLSELGHQPEFGCELTGFRQDHEGVPATIMSLAGEETYAARYLVGTDGGRSFVRHGLKVDFPGKTPRLCRGCAARNVVRRGLRARSSPRRCSRPELAR
jgi:hypothetical protein